MCSTSFLQVNDESGLTLADIHPIGYLEVPDWAKAAKGGFKGKFVVKVLSPGGALEKDGENKDKCYKFYAPWTSANGWGATYWTQDNEGSQAKIADASTVKFPIGTGLWIEVTADSYFPKSGVNTYPDDQYKFQHSGAAMLDARQIDLRPGSKGISITVSSDITLANIHPIGYLEVPDWAKAAKGGFKGKFVVKVLSPGGALEKDGENKDKCYKFYAPWTSANGWGATYWTQDNEGSQAKIADASTVKFPIGTGLWIEVTADSYFPTAGVNKYDDDQHKVEFDGIENL